MIEPVVSCENCVHAYFGDGIFCGEFRELLVDESVAADCPAYEANLVWTERPA